MSENIALTEQNAPMLKLSSAYCQDYYTPPREIGSYTHLLNNYVYYLIALFQPNQLNILIFGQYRHVAAMNFVHLYSPLAD